MEKESRCSQIVYCRDVKECVFHRIYKRIDERICPGYWDHYGICIPESASRGPVILEDIGQAIGMSRQAVWQIEQKALKRMRHPMRIKILETLLDDVDEQEEYLMERLKRNARKL